MRAEFGSVVFCVFLIGQSHRCTASWEVEEGIRTVSLRHLVQHRQQLDRVSWLQERGEERRGEERRGEEGGEERRGEERRGEERRRKRK